MSYITDNLLTEEFRRIYLEANPGADVSKVYIYDRDRERRRHPFTAFVNGQEVKFTVPEDRLHSSPLSFVSRDYLKPLLKKVMP